MYTNTSRLSLKETNETKHLGHSSISKKQANSWRGRTTGLIKHEQRFDIKEHWWTFTPCPGYLDYRHAAQLPHNWWSTAVSWKMVDSAAFWNTFSCIWTSVGTAVQFQVRELPVCLTSFKKQLQTGIRIKNVLHWRQPIKPLINQ